MQFPVPAFGGPVHCPSSVFAVLFTTSVTGVTARAAYVQSEEPERDRPHDTDQRQSRQRARSNTYSTSVVSNVLTSPVLDSAADDDGSESSPDESGRPLIDDATPRALRSRRAKRSTNVPPRSSLAPGTLPRGPSVSLRTGLPVF